MRIIGVNNRFDVAVDLVGSKSESNRALMIAYYGGFMPRIKNISTSDDTRLLQNILHSLSVKPQSVASHDNPTVVDCHNAGTVLRFLLTALSFRDGDYILTGSDRMLNRPVGDLVDALRLVGADIDYLGKDNCPPLKIRGHKGDVRSKHVSVDITRSSQFASSILLAKPSSLHLEGDMSSVPYIDMTIDVMRAFGVETRRDGRDIVVGTSVYQDVEYVAESDWTSASYWYEAVALSENGRVRLRNLRLDSRQGDAVSAKWFERLGVNTTRDGDDLIISRVEKSSESADAAVTGDLSYDFIDNPDLFPTIAATCAGLQMEGRFTGLRNLVHKESDRVAAMMTELSKLDRVSGKDHPITFDSHDDHRIAMALAPLAMKIGAIEINNADVVSKSYPNFWTEFHKLC